MSQIDLEKFVEIAYKDVRLLGALLDNANTDQEVIERAVAAGAVQGFDFTEEELSAWITQQREAKKLGELSDLQLENVAGGHTNPFATTV